MKVRTSTMKIIKLCKITRNSLHQLSASFLLFIKPATYNSTACFERFNSQQWDLCQRYTNYHRSHCRLTAFTRFSTVNSSTYMVYIYTSWCITIWLLGVFFIIEISRLVVICFHRYNLSYGTIMESLDELYETQSAVVLVSNLNLSDIN